MAQLSISEDYTSHISKAYEENFKSLCAQVFKMVPDYNVAKDIVQEVFIKVWKNQIDFTNISNTNHYLNRAVKNRCLNYLRDKKEVCTDDFNIYNLKHSRPITLEKEELSEQISKIISSLPERCQLIFKMSRYEEKKYAEIAEELGISVKTVENQISRALKTLRSSLLYK